jgi:tRNA uridine 5-carboxymethylaminomethyl modification enzyme
LPCWVTHTNRKTHDIIRSASTVADVFRRDPGSRAARTVPSIEDKIHRFAGKESHQIFLEPEG